MTIEITITGNHSTDILAEIKNLAEALGGTKTKVTTIEPSEPVQIPLKEDDKKVEVPEEVKSKKLTAKQQKEHVAAMIEKGEIDEDIFNQLTKKNQKAIQDGLEEQRAEQEAEDDFNDMFDEPEEKSTLTIEDLRDIMAEKSDKGGQKAMLDLRKVLERFIPEGKPVRLSSLSEDKYEEAYKAFRAV